MYLHLSVVSFHCPEGVDFTIHWFLKYYHCYNEYNNIEVSTAALCHHIFWGSCRS